MHHAGAWPSAAKNVITFGQLGEAKEARGQQVREKGSWFWLRRSLEPIEVRAARHNAGFGAKLAAGRVDTKASPTQRSVNMQLDYPQAAAAATVATATATATAAAVVSLWPPLSVAPTHES